MRVSKSLRNAVCGLLLACMALGAWAETVRVLSAAAVQVPVEEGAKKFESATGHKVVFEFSTGGGVDAKVKAVVDPLAKFDLVFNDVVRLQALGNAGLVNTQAPKVLGHVRIGIAARAGANKPKIDTLDSFKASLLSASSIAYGDPSRGATTGIHFAKVIERLGIKDEVNQKALLAANGLEVMKLVDSGRAELGITQISEIKHIAAQTLVGPLPTVVQLKTTYAASFGKAAPSAATQSFLEALISADGQKYFQYAGFE